MPYLDCPTCRVTVYVAPRLTPLEKCPRCGSRDLGDPGRLFEQVRRFQLGRQESQTLRTGPGR